MTQLNLNKCTCIFRLVLISSFSDSPARHKHNPYAEWYFNTMRFPDGPTAEHHRKVYNDAPYDDFLDTWKAKDFDADKLVRMFKRAWARYVVPVSKHHVSWIQYHTSVFADELRMV